ncbi:hypothetical protein AAG570_000444 [Ranatra chinensis]|uniref:Ribosomal protein L2 n=1 Tax=Ranatra chinensis TaxID=642074 RepID=A0ABD0YX40_9HEMI
MLDSVAYVRNGTFVRSEGKASTPHCNGRPERELHRSERGIYHACVANEPDVIPDPAGNGIATWSNSGPRNFGLQFPKSHANHSIRNERIGGGQRKKTGRPDNLLNPGITARSIVHYPPPRLNKTLLAKYTIRKLAEF